MIPVLASFLLALSPGQADAWGKLEERLKAANSLQATLEIQMGSQKQAMAFKIMRPNLISYKMGPMEMYFDGKQAWMYMAEMKKYVKQPAMEGQDMRQLPMIGLEAFWRDEAKAKAGPVVEKEVAGKKVWTTVLTYPKGTPMADYSIEMVLSPETGLPASFDVKRGGKSEGGAVYKELLLDPALKPEDFVFTPPAGATEMKPDEAMGGGQDFEANLLKVGSAAPDFSLKTPEGTSIGLKATAAKSKAVLVNFWFYG